MTMKKIITIFVLLIIPIFCYAESSESYIAMDADTLRVLDGKNINREKLIASTSKIMTAIIIIENMELNQSVVVDNIILKAYGSSMYLEVGEELKIIDLLYGLMLRSGNDTAMVLAHIFDSSKDFAQVMNEYAKKIGMNNTNFINSSGLENGDGIGNTSTAYDMALLMSYAIKNPIFLKISGSKYYQFQSSKKKYNLKNKNKLLFMDKRVVAGKTGYTKKAKRTLVTAAIDGNKKIVVVTLNDGNDFNDHLMLYQRLFKDYGFVNLCDDIKKIEDPLNLYDGFSFVYNEDCNILLNKNEKKQIKTEYILFNGVDYKNIENEVVGYINFKLNDVSIYQNKIMIKKKYTILDILRKWLYG